MIHAFAIVPRIGCSYGLVHVTWLSLVLDPQEAQFALSLTLIESILFYSVIRAIAIIICKGMMMMVILTLGMV